jgi:hypothetical protein
MQVERAARSFYNGCEMKGKNIVDATSSPPSRARQVALFFVMVCVTAAAALLVAEVILRVTSIPGISYHAFYYDSVTGGRNYPHAKLMYRNKRGEKVMRHTNAWGFPDVEHSVKREPGVLRIGFFGDSYTEAMQVPLEDTFFRVVERELNERIQEMSGATNRHGEPIRHIEVICFGMSGRGTLQSYLECQQQMDRVDLDYVVYVFVENDPMDQIQSLKGSDIVPYPILSADTFVVDSSFDERYGYKARAPHRAIQYLKAHSLVVSTIEGRLKLLRAYGIKRGVTEAERTGAVGPAGRAGMAPSTWPDSLVTVGGELIERVLGRWARDVARSGRRFVVMRVPREEVLLQPLAEQDSWAPALHAFCARERIPLVDPTPYLAERERAGHEVYYDHLTREGHRVFAAAFVSFLLASECNHH